MGWRDQALSVQLCTEEERERGAWGAGACTLSGWVGKKAEEAGSLEPGACEGPDLDSAGARSVWQRPSPSGSGGGRAEAFGWTW